MDDLESFWLHRMDPVLEGLGQRFVVKKDATKTPLGIRVELKPKYEGFRGHRCDGHTMVHQSVLIGGIVAVQLELPTVVRRELMENEEFFAQFARCIADLYTEIVVKWKGLFAASSHITETNGGCRTDCAAVFGPEGSVKNEQLDLEETRNLLHRITSISKSILVRCKGRDWFRMQKRLNRSR